MTIEEAIKQKSQFRSPYERMRVNLIFTSNALNNDHTRWLRPYGLTLPQYNVLRILRGQYPQTAMINDISERMLDKMSNASRLVDKLVDKGLVKRTVNAIDRRAVDITITDKGLALLKKLDNFLNEWDKRQQTQLSEQEVETLCMLLDKLRAD